jgi:hypothetical protein
LATTVFGEVMLDHFTLVNIFEHLSHFVYNIESTLDFEFLKHHFFSFLRDGTLVKKSLGETISISFDEYIAGVQAAEESND